MTRPGSTPAVSFVYWRAMTTRRFVGYWSRGLSVGAVSVAMLAWTAPAEATFVATAQDAASDSSDPSAGRDLTAIALAYDRRSGTLNGAVRLRGEPTEETPALLTLFAGRRSANGCNGVPAAGFGSDTMDWSARWLRVDDAAGNGPRGDAVKRGTTTSVQQFEAEDPQLAGQQVDCAIAILSEPGNADNVFDTAGPFDLVGQPALAMNITRVPRRLTPGRAHTIKLTVSNPGDAPTGPLRLAARHRRGLTVKVDRTLASIPPGGHLTTSAKVTVSRRAAARTPLAVTATAGELHVRATATLVARDHAGGGGSGGSSSSGVCNRYIGYPDGSGALILVPC